MTDMVFRLSKLCSMKVKTRVPNKQKWSSCWLCC